MKNKICKGIILEVVNNSCYKVWFPLENGTVPIGGAWDTLYANTNSALDGIALSDAIDSSILCTVALPLASGSWFKALVGKAASVFDRLFKEGDTIYDYRLVPNYKPNRYLTRTSLQNASDTPAASLSVCNPSLNVVGGTPIPQPGNLPPGKFIELEVGQHVLVLFADNERIGTIIASLPGKAAYDVVLG